MQWMYVQIFGSVVHGGGFPISVVPVPCDGSTLKYSDHETIRRLTDSPQYVLSGELKQVVEEYKFFLSHLVRKTYQLEYIKCKSHTCAYCRNKPVRAHNCIAYLDRHGQSMPTPSMSTTHHGHDNTFMVDEATGSPPNCRISPKQQRTT